MIVRVTFCVSVSLETFRQRLIDGREDLHSVASRTALLPRTRDRYSSIREISSFASPFYTAGIFGTTKAPVRVARNQDPSIA